MRFVHTITAPRLRLVTLSAPVLEALLIERPRADELVDFKLPSGWPEDEDRAVLELRLRQLRAQPGIEPWLLRALVDRNDVMVGHAGFHYPPAPVDEALDENFSGSREPAEGGLSELGYTIFEPFRGRGYATEAVRALVDWGFKEMGLGAALACTSPSNVASRKVLERVGGWREIGRAIDELDGEEIVFRRDRL
ncbi:MAG: GNAT family N-acetyltransferase [Actinomycetota bacterium]|nr:GNAT family N-acetyltransferase [Actinomycetota bacterium]